LFEVKNRMTKIPMNFSTTKTEVLRKGKNNNLE